MENKRYVIQLDFEEIKLPPFEDILILGKNSAQGRLGLSKSFEIMAPNGYDVFEAEDAEVEAIFINKRLLRKIPSYTVLEILREKVIPYISQGELLKVNLKLSVQYANVEISP